MVEREPGTFYGPASNGGTAGSGVIFQYSFSKPGTIEVVHDFSAVNAAGDNSDGASPSARLTPGLDGSFYSTASQGGANGNGLVYRICPDGSFHVLHSFSAINQTDASNSDGAKPNFGVILQEHSLIGTALYGGNGSSAGFFNSGGTLYQQSLEDDSE